MDHVRVAVRVGRRADDANDMYSLATCKIFRQLLTICIGTVLLPRSHAVRNLLCVVMD